MTTLEALKQSVLAVNKVLKDKEKTMGVIELLRNCHSIYRGEYAFRLYKEKLLSKSNSEQFIKVPKYNLNT